MSRCPHPQPSALSPEVKTPGCGSTSWGWTNWFSSGYPGKQLIMVSASFWLQLQRGHSQAWNKLGLRSNASMATDNYHPHTLLIISESTWMYTEKRKQAREEKRLHSTQGPKTNFKSWLWVRCYYGGNGRSCELILGAF